MGTKMKPSCEGGSGKKGHYHSISFEFRCSMSKQLRKIGRLNSLEATWDFLICKENLCSAEAARWKHPRGLGTQGHFQILPLAERPS